MTHCIYLDLTHEFNAGRIRVILSSGQAVVMHGLAFASKDGDWIAREDAESLDFILDVLERRGAKYRLGAPLDARWLERAPVFARRFLERQTKTRIVGRKLRR